MHHKTPIIFVKTIISVQSQGQIEMSAAQNVTTSFRQQNCHCCPQGGDNGDGHTSGLSQQPITNHETDKADQYNGITKISLARFISLDCCLLFLLSNLIEMAPQWPW